MTGNMYLCMLTYTSTCSFIWIWQRDLSGCQHSCSKTAIKTNLQSSNCSISFSDLIYKVMRNLRKIASSYSIHEAVSLSYLLSSIYFLKLSWQNENTFGDASFTILFTGTIYGLYSKQTFMLMTAVLLFVIWMQKHTGTDSPVISATSHLGYRRDDSAKLTRRQPTGRQILDDRATWVG